MSNLYRNLPRAMFAMPFRKNKALFLFNRSKILQFQLRFGSTQIFDAGLKLDANMLLEFSSN